MSLDGLFFLTRIVDITVKSLGLVLSVVRDTGKPMKLIT